MKSVFNSTILLLGGAFVILAWFVVFFCGSQKEVSFEALGTLFTGLGFVGILATLAHERGQADAREKEHQQLLATMRMQTRVQITATLQATYINQWAALYRVSSIPGPIVRTNQAETVAWDAANEYGQELEKLKSELAGLDAKAHG